MTSINFENIRGTTSQVAARDPMCSNSCRQMEGNLEGGNIYSAYTNACSLPLPLSRHYPSVDYLYRRWTESICPKNSTRKLSSSYLCNDTEREFCTLLSSIPSSNVIYSQAIKLVQIYRGIIVNSTTTFSVKHM